MTIQRIKLTQLLLNDGQIIGLPKNPRFIRDERFQKLVQSIRELPEMLELRELIVFPHGKKFVVIGGNMRLRAMKEIGFTEAPCKVIKAETPVNILREIAIKDNLDFGSDDLDILANEWDKTELEDWGFEFPVFEDFEDEEPEETLPKPDEDNMIAVTLTDEERDVWTQAKDHIGIKNDKKAIFRLIEFMYNTENEE